MKSNIEALPTLLQKVREVSVIDMRVALANFDLTEQQWRVISSVADAGEINAQDLAEKSAILGPSLSRILSRLESDGILNRKVSPTDQRELNISLSAKGRRLHSRVAPKVAKSYDGFKSLISENKLKQLNNLLQDILKKAVN